LEEAIPDCIECGEKAYSANNLYCCKTFCAVSAESSPEEGQANGRKVEKGHGKGREKGGPSSIGSLLTPASGLHNESSPLTQMKEAQKDPNGSMAMMMGNGASKGGEEVWFPEVSPPDYKLGLSNEPVDQYIHQHHIRLWLHRMERSMGRSLAHESDGDEKAVLFEHRRITSLLEEQALRVQSGASSSKDLPPGR
jgi:hypothetical protein